MSSLQPRDGQICIQSVIYRDAAGNNVSSPPSDLTLETIPLSCGCGWGQPLPPPRKKRGMWRRIGRSIMQFGRHLVCLPLYFFSVGRFGIVSGVVTTCLAFQESFSSGIITLSAMPFTAASTLIYLCLIPFISIEKCLRDEDDENSYPSIW